MIFDDCCANLFSILYLNENIQRSLNEEFSKTCVIAGIFALLLLVYLVKFFPEYREFIDDLKLKKSINCKCTLCVEDQNIFSALQNRYNAHTIQN